LLVPFAFSSYSITELFSPQCTIGSLWAREEMW
jgi:hypothetical protein